MRDDNLDHEPLVSIVTVTFNSAEHIRGCVASVSRSVGTMPIEHIVIDNASRDGASALIRAEFPHVMLVENTLNRGLTAANNQGAELARGRYVVFLNPDTIVPDGTFQTMLAIMERHPDIGVLAPRLVDEMERFGPGLMGHRAPTAWTVINAFLLLSRTLSRFFSGDPPDQGCGGARGLRLGMRSLPDGASRGCRQLQLGGIWVGG